MYDILIIGAGPSGSTLARLLDKNYKVLLVDKRPLHEPNKKDGLVKCCGGLLAPDAQKMLAKLGLGVPKDVLVSPQMFCVKTIDFDNSLKGFYQRHYINIDREKFDRWLFSIIGSSVETKTNCLFLSHQVSDDYIVVKLREDTKEINVKTKLLIGADGAFSQVRKYGFGDKPFPKKYVAVQNWYYTKKELPHFVSIFDKSITDFYSWIIQKEDKVLIGSAIPFGEDINAKYQMLIDKLVAYGYEFGELYKKEGTLISRPQKLNQISLVNGNIALIGEAAGFISPSSAEGISYAMKTAVALANSINNNIKTYAHGYVKNMRSLKRNIILKNLKSPFMYNSFLRKMVIKSGVLSIKVDE